MGDEISHSLVRTLRNVPIFALLSDSDLLHIAGTSANLHWDADSTIFETGAPADALYIVLSGRVRICQPDRGQEREVASIGEGDYFGEISLMLDRKHSRSAAAAEPTELMVIPTELFRGLLEGDSRLADHLRSRMEERLKAVGAEGDEET